MFLVIEEANTVTLEKIPFESDFKETNAEFEYHLDHKVTEADVTVSYNSSTDKTTFTLPYRLRAKMDIVGRFLANNETSTFVDINGVTQTLKPATVIQSTNLTNGSTATIEASGDYRNANLL